jgi:hypothetical protein
LAAAIRASRALGRLLRVLVGVFQGIVIGPLGGVAFGLRRGLDAEQFGVEELVLGLKLRLLVFEVEGLEFVGLLARVPSQFALVPLAVDIGDSLFVLRIDSGSAPLARLASSSFA